MDRTTLTLAGIAWTVVLASVAVAPALVGPATAAVADVDERPDAYSIEQGECIPVFLTGDASENVTEYYDYRSDPGDEFSSHGTVDVQESGVSQLYVYRGSEGDSLVVLHDRLEDGEGGGAVSMTFDGHTAEQTWAVLDDDYDEPDDRYQVEETRSEMDWMWAPNRTDGGAMRGVAALGSDEIVIDPAFNEESYAATEREPQWPYALDEVSWAVRTQDGSLEPLDRSSTVTFRPGDCSPPTADLSASPGTPGVDEDVTFDASGSSDDGGIVEYRWDVDGDGSIDDTTTDPTYVHAYGSEGEFTASVTVVDWSGDTATATTTIDVEFSVTADADVPETAVVNETVTFDGSNSTPSDGIDSYEWAVDGNQLDGPVVEHTFESAGTYDVTLTVTGQDDSDSTTSTIEVTEQLSASISANRTNVTTGDPIAFSTDASPEDVVDEYRYDFGDGGTATGQTDVYAYDEPGEYTVVVTVTGTDGQSVTSSTSISVEADEETGDGDGGDGDGGDGDGDGSDGDGGDGDGSDDSAGSGGGGGGAAPPPGIPEIELVDASLDADEVAPGERVVVAATLENSGNGGGTTVLSLRVDGETVDTLNVFVGAEDTRTYQLDHRFEDAGEYSLAINDTSAGRLTVVDDATDGDGPPLQQSDAVALVEISPPTRSITVDEATTFEAVLTNEGTDPATVEVSLLVDGEVATTETVDVPPGEPTTVALEHRFTAPGEYEVGVEETTMTVVVEDDQTATADDGPGGAGIGPGDPTMLGLVGAVALVSAVVGLSRML